MENHADKGLRADLIELRDHWRDCNERFFDGRMHEPYITLTEPSAPQVYGQCCSESSWGSRLEIRIRPSLLAGTHPHMGSPRAGRIQFVKDVLLHEMIHQHVMEHQPDVDEDSYHGHGPVFTAHCNRIGALLELPEVVARNRAGKPRQPKSPQWPHCVVPPDRYLGAWQRAVTASGDSKTEQGPVPAAGYGWSRNRFWTYHSGPWNFGTERHPSRPCPSRLDASDADFVERYVFGVASIAENLQPTNPGCEPLPEGYPYDVTEALPDGLPATITPERADFLAEWLAHGIDRAGELLALLERRSREDWPDEEEL